MAEKCKHDSDRKRGHLPEAECTARWEMGRIMKARPGPQDKTMHCRLCCGFPWLSCGECNSPGWSGSPGTGQWRDLPGAATGLGRFDEMGDIFEISIHVWPVVRPARWRSEYTRRIWRLTGQDGFTRCKRNSRRSCLALWKRKTDTERKGEEYITSHGQVGGVCWVGYALGAVACFVWPKKTFARFRDSVRMDRRRQTSYYGSCFAQSCHVNAPPGVCKGCHNVINLDHCWKVEIQKRRKKDVAVRISPLTKCLLEVFFFGFRF